MPAPTLGYVTTVQHPDEEIGVRAVHSWDCMCVRVNFYFCEKLGVMTGTGLNSWWRWVAVMSSNVRRKQPPASFLVLGKSSQSFVFE